MIITVRIFTIDQNSRVRLTRRKGLYITARTAKIQVQPVIDSRWLRAAMYRQAGQTSHRRKR